MRMGDPMVGVVGTLLRRDTRGLARGHAHSLLREDTVTGQPSVSQEESPYQKLTVQPPDLGRQTKV